MSSDFGTILDGSKIKARRRLFMTTTPHYYARQQAAGRQGGGLRVRRVPHNTSAADSMTAFRPLPPWHATKLVDYLATDHPRATSRLRRYGHHATTVAGTGPRGKRYSVPLDWRQPLAMGTFYDTILASILHRG